MTREQLAKILEAESNPLDVLSDKEMEVFSMLGQGYSSRNISEELALATEETQKLREKIRVKLKLKTDVQVLQSALKWKNG